jgi:hypothetical protein
MFTRWRTIKGHRYLYGEKRWRENGKVKSKSWVIQSGGGVVSPDGSDWSHLGHGGYTEQMAQYPSDPDEGEPSRE